MGLGSALARGISGVASGVSRASQSWPEERARQANLLQRQHEFDLGEESRIAKEAEAARELQRKMKYESDKIHLEWATQEVERLKESPNVTREQLGEATQKMLTLRTSVTEYFRPTDQSEVVTPIPGIVPVKDSGPSVEPRSAGPKAMEDLSGTYGGVETAQQETEEGLPGIQSVDDPTISGPAWKLTDSMIADANSNALTDSIKKYMIKYVENNGSISGEDGAIGAGEYLLGRPMTEEERADILPTLIGAIPVHREEDGIFKILMGIEDKAERHAAFFGGVSAPMRETLWGHPTYGEQLDISMVPPKKQDPWMMREGMKVQLPILSLNLLEEYMNQPEILGKMGPISGRWTSMSPWDSGMRLFDAEAKLTKQIVGKFLEGGVLRKEDESKYQAILPQASDLPIVAQGKIDNLRLILHSMRDLYKFGEITTTLDAEGKEVPMVHFPDLPWNPGSEATDLEEIRTWLIDNADHEYASEVMDVWTTRSAARRHVNKHGGQ